MPRNCPECFDDTDDAYATGQCKIHVSCDLDCGALLDPVTPNEIEDAYRHWRRHGWLRGCSHGH